MSWDDWVRASLADIDRRNLRRALHPVTQTGTVDVVREGRPLVLFSSNDYLGLSNHPEVVTAYHEAKGSGPRGSALICGFTDSHEALQLELAEAKGCEASLLFPTGFAANLGVLTALAAEDVEFFSDSLNHASIIDGLSLAKRRGAKVTVYPHADMTELETALDQSTAQRKVIVSDGVFSMDGDIAPYAKLVELKARFDALLVVDDAHGFLVFENGSAGEFSKHVDLHIGTLSKAAGAHGGFVAGPQVWIDLLLNRARPFVFSTATPVPVVEAARAAVRVSRQEPMHRESLFRNMDRLSNALDREVATPIVPVVLNEEARALSAAQGLAQDGFHVIAIRPPTVPEGTSRLRIALSAAHSDAQIDGLVAALGRI